MPSAPEPAHAPLTAVIAEPLLEGEWELAALPPGSADSPAALARATPEWIPCPGPMPVAAALRAAGLAEREPARDLDADDWWFRCRFAAPLGTGRARLRFQGLATVAEVWLNGLHLLRSESMFLEHEVDAPGLRPFANELLIRCHALAPLLQASRRRARWRTRLVSTQQLRHYRTTLLGRMPGWCPPVAAVGPWRPILLLPETPIRIASVKLGTEVLGDAGSVEAQIELQSGPGVSLREAVLTVGAVRRSLELTAQPGGAWSLRGILRLPAVELWWPHTHGAQPLYPARLSLELAGERIEFELGQVGFRTIAVDRGADGEGFGLRVNGQAIFCRGACWTPLDLARLVADPAEYRVALTQARHAGMNMIRVGGTMVYEADAFYQLCDELGILVWQDFMFANLDYPTDPGFAASVAQEARQFLLRMQGRPSLAVLCGNSEVEQQAAMLGLPAERSANPLFSELLPAQCAALAANVPWLSSTPTAGTHPFQVDRGVSHYYGVGAYLRPLEDARRAGVRFASECLAFSNVPEPATVARVGGGGGVYAPTHPEWKAAVPRDPGAGWDFEDVRDFYLERLFAVSPQEVRAADPERYLALGRVATGEVIERTLGEWRRSGSTCRGGLVWLLRDLVPGAGWGLVDSTGRPKPAWWYFRRASRPCAMTVSDEGLNGLFLHVFNDHAAPLEAELRVLIYREGSICVGSGRTAVSVAAHGSAIVHADALLEGFRDLTQAYRFGPPGHDVVAAVLTRASDGGYLASGFHWPLGLPAARAEELGLKATAKPADDGYLLQLETSRVALGVAIRGNHLVPDDNYLTLAPDAPRTIRLRSESEERPLRLTVEALNGTRSVPVEFLTP